MHVERAHRPSTTMAHTRHFKTVLAFLIFVSLPLEISLGNLLVFLQFLYENCLSPKVIKNYLFSIHSKAKLFNIICEAVSHEAIYRYLRSITINSTFRPTPRPIFDIPTLYSISLACDILQDPCLYRAIFLTAFFGFLCMSNIATIVLRILISVFTF